jgi:glycosyltransferase involved in cell wall biosynthesis
MDSNQKAVMRHIEIRRRVLNARILAHGLRSKLEEKWRVFYYVYFKPLYYNLISVLSFGLYKSLFFFNKSEIDTLRKREIGIDAKILINNISGLERYIYQLVVNLSKVDKDNPYTIFVHKPVFNDKIGENFKEKLEKDITNHIISQNKKLATQEIKVFHVTWQDMYLWHNLPLLWSKRSVITIHDLINLRQPDYHGRMNRIKYRLLLKLAVKWADRIITVSDYTKDEIIKHLNADNNKIKVVHLAADSRFKPVLNKRTIREIKSKYKIEGKYILSVGKSYTHKNIPHLIRAFKKLATGGNLEHKLVLVGEKFWGPANLDVMKTIEDLELGEKVIWPGYIDDEDMPSLYSGAELFVMPSYYEGFGLPLLEAMSCGTPVIASNVTSIPEVVGNAGILVSPDDVDELTQSMLTLIKDKKKRNALIEKGLERSRMFSWEKCARETVDVYKDLLSA